jgi:hypothetical protein
MTQDIAARGARAQIARLGKGRAGARCWGRRCSIAEAAADGAGRWWRLKCPPQRCPLPARRPQPIPTFQLPPARSHAILKPPCGGQAPGVGRSPPRRPSVGPPAVQRAPRARQRPPGRPRPSKTSPPGRLARRGGAAAPRAAAEAAAACASVRARAPTPRPCGNGGGPMPPRAPPGRRRASAAAPAAAAAPMRARGATPGRARRARALPLQQRLRRRGWRRRRRRRRRCGRGRGVPLFGAPAPAAALATAVAAQWAGPAGRGRAARVAARRLVLGGCAPPRDGGARGGRRVRLPRRPEHERAAGERALRGQRRVRPG